MLTIVLRDNRSKYIDYNPEIYFDMIREGLIDLQHDLSTGIISVIAISTSKSVDECGNYVPSCPAHCLDDALEALSNVADDIGRMVDHLGK